MKTSAPERWNYTLHLCLAKLTAYLAKKPLLSFAIVNYMSWISILMFRVK